MAIEPHLLHELAEFLSTLGSAPLATHLDGAGVSEMSEDTRRFVDTKTRYQGVFARHQLSCDLAADGSKRCTCKPSYYGTVWDKERGLNRRTARGQTVSEARNRRADLLARVRSKRAEPIAVRMSFRDAHTSFISDCKDGVALNKHGRRYKAAAIANLDSSLKKLPAPLRGKQLTEIGRGDLQRAVDDFRRAGLSSSRIRGVVNSARALYRWAEDRELVTDHELDRVRLPANDSVERDRVASPGEFALLLSKLKGADALPLALAGYGTARLQEIRALEWSEVDFERGLILLADDEEARKSEAARRVVPMVACLRARLRAQWIAQDRPTSGRVCPPRRESDSGMVSLDQLQKRVKKIWEDQKLRPIGLQEARHTSATWLDHAGVAPKVALVFMGHKAPQRQPDAAPITLRRYTHVLPGELERARDQLDRFIAEREVGEENDDFSSSE
ncbi:MAG: tyrosine-type recombinase/integrase [Actinobacteria bacterium]|nr:tyrosine-type recombinase/integrase [Actinomycetota bacterium]